MLSSSFSFGGFPSGLISLPLVLGWWICGIEMSVHQKLDGKVTSILWCIIWFFFSPLFCLFSYNWRCKFFLLLQDMYLVEIAVKRPLYQTTICLTLFEYAVKWFFFFFFVINSLSVRTGLEGPGLTVAQKIWYCIASVGGQYIWARLQSFSAFRRWGDTERVICDILLSISFSL